MCKDTDMYSQLCTCTHMCAHALTQTHTCKIMQLHWEQKGPRVVDFRECGEACLLRPTGA